jgi:hypothetical protein
VNDLLDLARGVAATLDAPHGTALTGSCADGTARGHSDVDLIALGDTSRPMTSHHVRGRLVTVAWTTPADARDALTSPWEAPSAVPGWRSAIALADPGGHIAALTAAADAWTWDVIGDRAATAAAATLVALS